MMISLAVGLSSLAWWYVTLGLLVLLLVVIELDRHERERLNRQCDRLRAQRDRLLSRGSENEDEARGERLIAVIARLLGELAEVPRSTLVDPPSEDDIEALMNAHDGLIYPVCPMTLEELEETIAAKIDQQPWKGIRCDCKRPTDPPTSSVSPNTDPANLP